MLILSRVVPIISDNSSGDASFRCECHASLSCRVRELAAKASRAQPLPAINRRNIGDHLLLVDDAHGQVTHKAFK